MTEKKKISAHIIADSLNEQGNRLTTFVLTFPRIVLAEFNTHRMISRNSASSRAIPFEKMVKMVKEDPFIPIKWMKEHKGMQGTEYLDEQYSFECEQRWLIARDNAVREADYLSGYGLTKQICNRLLEPFMWHTVITTGTEWENFFALRAHNDAEIHIQELAYRMLDEYNAHIPKQLRAGEWHIPFGDKIGEGEKWIELQDTINKGERVRWSENEFKENIEKTKVQIATARCARVSYLNFDGKDDYEADIKLHDRLMESGHMSPFEHCARAMSEWEYENNFIMTVGYYSNGSHRGERTISEGWSGNFRGFIQYRKMLAGENKIDNRVNK